MIKNGGRSLAQRFGEDLGHIRDPLRIEAKIVPVERVVEHVRGVEAGIAKHTLRVDCQPVARPVQDVVVMQVAMQRHDIVRIGQQPIGDCRGLDIETVMAGVAVARGFPEQAGKPLPERLQLGREGVFPRRKQFRHHFGRDFSGGVVALFVENLLQQGFTGIFEQHAVAVAAKQADRAVAAPPGEIVLAAQFVRDVVERLERLDDRRRTILVPHLPDAARKGFGNKFGRADLPARRKDRCVHQRPSIKSMFCTAAPEAPLPRLS